jgi:hypothetical protein
MDTLDKGTLKEIEEMKGVDEMTLMINSEFSALVEALLMLYSDVQAANAAGVELQSTGSTN